jgi:hypothetical protein
MSNVKWTDVIDYFEGRNPGDAYQYGNSGCCAAAQFNSVRGRTYTVPTIERNKPFSSSRRTGDLDVDLEVCAAAEPHTMGALAKRVKEFV